MATTATPNTTLNAIPGENFDQYEARLGATKGGVGTNFTPSPAPPAPSPINTTTPNGTAAPNPDASQKPANTTTSKQSGTISGPATNDSNPSAKVVSDIPYGNNQRKVTYADGTSDVVNQTTNPDNSVSYFPTSTTPGSPKTLTFPDGNQYTVDAQGNITGGQTGAKYQVGSNISSYDNSTYLKTLLNGGTPDSANAAQAQADYEKTATDTQAQGQKYQAQIDAITNGTVPLTAGQQAQVDALKASFQNLIDQQVLTNTGASGLANTRGYQAGAAEYDANFQTNAIGSIITAGQNKVSDLNIKMAGAIASLTEGFKQNDIDAIKAAWNTYSDAQQARTDELKKTVDDANKKIKDAQDALTTAQKDAQDRKDKIQSDINSVLTDAAKNGATQDVLSAIGKATDVASATAAAGGYLQTATGQLGDYLQYKKDTLAKGLTPTDYDTWKTQDDAKQAKIKASEAYSTAYNTAAGKSAAEQKYGTGTDTPTTEPVANATGITQATGLPLVVFNYLTQGTSALTRMTAAQRQGVMNQANDFLNKNGLDYSTFQSQFKAQNDVLQKNIERAANTKIFAGETSGSADALMAAINTKDMGNIKKANVLKLLLGQEVNDPTTEKYDFQLKAMGNDLAGYFAASRGATSPDDSDKRDAADVIANGMSTRSVQAFKDSINANEEKVAGVVQNAVNSSQKSVWDLFGVGSKYAPHAAQVNPKDAVDSYIKTNPTQAENIAKLYDVPGATDQDVLDYINKITPTK